MNEEKNNLTKLSIQPMIENILRDNFVTFFFFIHAIDLIQLNIISLSFDHKAMID